MVKLFVSALNSFWGRSSRVGSGRSGRVGSAKDGNPNEQVLRAGLPHSVVAQCLGLADEGVAINGPSHGLGAALFKGCHSGRVGSGRPWLSWWPLWPWWPPPPILINDIRCQSRSGPGQPTFLHPPSHPTHPHTHHPHRHHTHKHTVKCVRDNNHHALWFYVDKTSATFGYTGSASTPTPTKSTGGLDRRAGQPFTDFAERIMGGAGLMSLLKGVVNVSRA